MLEGKARDEDGGGAEGIGCGGGVEVGVDGAMKVEVLIPQEADHPGAGAVVVRHAVTEATLKELDVLRQGLPLDKRRPTAHRRFFRDEDGKVRRVVMAALRKAGVTKDGDDMMPWFRFIEYGKGGCMAPHTDGSNGHPDTRAKSTATVLLYLSTCRDGGGGTALLQHTRTNSKQLAVVVPQRGSMLVFPHVCPHEGLAVGNDPKIALRAELIQSPSTSC